MSCIELITFDKNGRYTEERYIRNTWLGAIKIWRRLFRKYYPNEDWNTELYLNDCKNVWKLSKNPNITETELICLFYTYDYALIERKNINRLVTALKILHNEEDEDSLLEQADIIDELFKNENIEYLGTHQNSVSCNFWSREEDNCLKKGWLMFEEIDKNKGDK